MKTDIEKVVDLIHDAGGKVVGRTRLQKMACLLELAGVGYGFYFVYHHYGPYCEELTWAAESAQVMELIIEEEKPALWGGVYSIYTLPSPPQPRTDDPIRTRLTRCAVEANVVALELAVTAAYFAKRNTSKPWKEVALCKPEKMKYLDAAKELYKEFRTITDELPEIEE